jgi:predicted outer membrane repeat protein
MINCLFINNTATQGGGAVSINNGRKVSFINDCDFVSNTADYGSAIYFSNAYDANITNCRFTDNVAGNDSGVIDFTGSYYQRKLSVKDNIFENNIPDKDYNVDEKIEIVDLGNNDRLVGEDVVMNGGDDKNFTVTLTDSQGNPIVSKLITVTLTDFLKKVTVLEGITDENGQAIISLINQTAGTYTVVSNFAGDSTWDNVSAINQIKIKAEHSNNIVFNESIVKVKAGESYMVQGYVMDEYLSYVVQAFSLYDISWVTHSGGGRVSTNHNINNGKFIIDVLDFDLSTQNEYYYINFTSTNENGNVAYGTLIVDTSIPLPPVDEKRDVIYVAKDGSDEFGDGSEENPLATPQVALYVNEVFGGNKVVFVKEGTYDISNYEIYANVSIIGEKGKTIFRQHTGEDGMLWLDNGVTTNFTNITFIDGYAAPYTLMGGSVIIVRYSGSIANFKGCEFYNNSGSSDGMMYVANGGIAYIDDCIFKNNSGKTFNPAGAILVLDGYLSVNNSYFAENFGAEGGAIFVGGDSVAFIENTVICSSAVKLNDIS